MNWTCPICERSFPSQNQWHSCIKRSYNDFLNDLSAEVKPLMHALLQPTENFVNVRRDVLKSTILFKKRAAFLAFKPTQKWVDIEFVLHNENDEFPIYKIIQSSKNKFWHVVRVEELDEIDSQLMNWMNEAYRLATD